MPATGLLDVIRLGGFTQVVCQIQDRHFGGKNTKGHFSGFPVQLSDDLSYSLGSTSGCKNDVLAITPQLSRGNIHNHLGDSNSKNYGHESFFNTKAVMDELNTGYLLVQEALLTILSELSYF